MNRFDTSDTLLAGLKVIERKLSQDNRGSFSRLFCSEELTKMGWLKPIMQINQSITKEKGTIRGLHFQSPPHDEMKLVSCLRGEVLDIAIDLRHGSPTFLQWHSEYLSDENQKALLIPEGFAHGFQTMTDDVELLYCHSRAYHQAAESGINPLDNLLSIEWPLPPATMSTRDLALPNIDSYFKGVIL